MKCQKASFSAALREILLVPRKNLAQAKVLIFSITLFDDQLFHRVAESLQLRFRPVKPFLCSNRALEKAAWRKQKADNGIGRKSQKVTG